MWKLFCLDPEFPETTVGLAEEFVREAYRKAKLEVTNVHYGSWSGAEISEVLSGYILAVRRYVLEFLMRAAAAVEEKSLVVNHTDRKRCTVIVLNYNGEHLLPACLDSLIKQTDAAIDTTVVDNGSTDGSAALVASRYPEVRFLALNSNFGFSRANNAAIQDALERGSDYTLLLNNDTFAATDFVSQMLSVMDADPTIAAVCPKIYFAHKPTTLWYAGGISTFGPVQQGIAAGCRRTKGSSTMIVTLHRRPAVRCWSGVARLKKWGCWISNFGSMRRISIGP